jgi:hypothetical protein
MATNPDSFANFDWIKERAKCTPFKVFEILHSQVEQDIHSRNQLSDDVVAHKTFSLQSNGEWFAVVYGGNKGVKFVQTEYGIQIQGMPFREVLHTGILMLSNDGQCRLKVVDEEYDLWQFRKLALHDLFFVNQEIVP